VVVKANIGSLNVWQTTLQDGHATVLFHNTGTVKVCSHCVTVYAVFSLNLLVFGHCTQSEILAKLY